MQTVCLSALCFLVFAALVGQSDIYNAAFTDSPNPRLLHASSAVIIGPQTRTPETETGQPGLWPQQGNKRKRVDVTEIKGQATELITMSQALPVQIDRIGNGVYPRELISNLKKIEKLSKQIRGEIE